MSERDDLVNFKLKKAEAALGEANILIENNFWSAAVSRTYYACFYAVGAILLTNDIKPTTHKGIQTMFNKQFVLTGLFSRELARFYSDLYGSRHLGDYGDFIDYNESTARGFLDNAKDFISEILQLIKKQNNI